LKLRGGSNNKSEVGTNNNTNKNRIAGEDKRRSSKPKKDQSKYKDKNKDKDKSKDKRNGTSSSSSRKNKRKQTIDDEEISVGVKGDDVDSDNSLQDREEEVATTTPEITEKKSGSKLFLVDPIRMNELAQYEASIEQTKNNEDEADTDTDTDTVEEAATIAAIVEELDNENKNEDDAHDKRRNKNGKKKRDRTKATTMNKSSSTMERTNNGTEEKKKTNTSKEGENPDAFQEESEIEGDDEVTKVDSNTTDEFNPYWWVDVWTQQLSDPEDFEEEDVDAVVDVDVDVDVDVCVDIIDGESSGISDSIGKIEDNVQGKVKKAAREGEKRRTNGKKKKDKEARSTSDTLKLPIEPDVNATVSTDLTSSSTIEATPKALLENENISSSDVDENITTTFSESDLDLAPSYVSSGAWVPIDNLITIGLASKFPSLRLSRKVRVIRKVTARVTGLHGVLSGKPSRSLNETTTNIDTTLTGVDEKSMYNIQKQIAAINKARERVEQAQAEEKSRRQKKSFWGFVAKGDTDLEASVGGSKNTEDETTRDSDGLGEPKVPQRSPEEIEEEFQRMERVREIDTLISEGQNRLAELICEKDVLQRRPNPLFNYTTTETIITTEASTSERAAADRNNKAESSSSKEAYAMKKVEIQATRQMNFPPDDLVAEYLDMMLSTRRLTEMNHTHLWRENENTDDDDDEESIGDDLFTPSADAHRLYQRSPSSSTRNRNGSRNGKKGGGGSWLLRQSIGNGPTLGEKIGQAVETAAYKAVTAALMSFLARLISSLHGINVLKHSDIRLVLEQSPDLPPVAKDGIIRGDHSNYAEETIKTVMRQKARRSNKRSSKRRISEASFVQQDAVTETLLSHVQISAPLLKLFPLAWQRALLGNIITLSCAIISDFVDGLHFQILGHQLSFVFRPITEVDMARHFQMAAGRFKRRRYKAAEFEAAVQATAEDLKEELKFLDSWHERALGSGVLRTQIADMIARIVLTLTDDVLSGAQMDLWSAQAGGPRMLAGLEHRIEEQS